MKQEILKPLGNLAAIIVMGVSGCGKSTVAAALAKKLEFLCEDGDSFHPAANVAKMHAGNPLTDDDRWPWLKAIANEIDAKAKTKTPIIVSCSALKHAYRKVLVHGRNDVGIVYLKGTRDIIAGRLALRTDHFMPASLLDSQLATIEEPQTDERIAIINIDAKVDAIVSQAIEKLSAMASS